MGISWACLVVGGQGAVLRPCGTVGRAAWRVTAFSETYRLSVVRTSFTGFEHQRLERGHLPRPESAGKVPERFLQTLEQRVGLARRSGPGTSASTTSDQTLPPQSAAPCSLCGSCWLLP